MLLKPEKSIIIKGADIQNYEDEFGNKIIGKPHIVNPNATIIFEGCNSSIEFGQFVNFEGLVRFHQSDDKVKLGNKCLIRANFGLFGNGSCIQIGDLVSMSATLLITAADGCVVHIGDDCLFAQDIALRAYDNHPIYDLATRKRINFARDIFIDSCVWLGNGVTVLGGAKIGHGSVVGTRSVVTASRPIGVHELAIGNPARVVKQGIAWAKPGNPPALEMSPDAHQDCLQNLNINKS